VAAVALGWLLAAWVSAAAGTYDHASTPLLVLNLVVLLPAAVAAVYVIGLQLGGTVLGIWFMAALLLVPMLGWWYAVPTYRDIYVDRVLVRALGLADDGRFAAGALALVAAALVLRSLTRGAAGWLEAALAGVAAGAALVIVPPAAPFLVGPVLAYVVALRFRLLGILAVTLVPFVLLVLLVRDAGIGLDIGWHAFRATMDAFREYFWSNRLLQWMAIAGVIGLARRSIPAAALFGGWFGAFVVADVASTHLSVADGSLPVALVPALPAYAVLVAGIPLLVPGLPRRLDARTAAR
jgi:hypothetical protein